MLRHALSILFLFCVSAAAYLSSWASALMACCAAVCYFFALSSASALKEENSIEALRRRLPTPLQLEGVNGPMLSASISSLWNEHAQPAFIFHFL